MWDDVWDAFAKTHQVIRFDTRGYGETKVTDDVPYSNRADIVAVLDAVGVERAVLVGVSRAGQIAVDTTIEYPDRIAALVAVAAGLGGADIEATPEEEAAGAEEERLYDAKDWDGMVELDLKLWVDGLGQSPDRAPAVRERVRVMAADIYANHSEEPVDQVIVLEPRAAGRLGEIRVPTLVIAGELDTPMTNACCRLIAEGVAGAKFVEMKGVAHLPPMEKPAEFVKLVEDFLIESDSS
jgi:pimeloyl-ACP methyl ester carboxylesterase